MRTKRYRSKKIVTVRGDLTSYPKTVFSSGHSRCLMVRELACHWLLCFLRQYTQLSGQFPHLKKKMEINNEVQQF